MSQNSNYSMPIRPDLWLGGVGASSEDAMMKCLRAGSAVITKEELKLLIDSMPHRVQAVIKAKGGPTKY